jgi:hypothetical protein
MEGQCQSLAASQAGANKQRDAVYELLLGENWLWL